jgi:two-component system nitrogen regulation sensor histidine kinase NtrY
LRSERVLAVAVVCLLALAAGVYYLIQRGKLGDARLATDKTLVMTVAVLLLMLTIGLGWVTVRNLALVLAGRRRGIIGSRLQARVTFSFLFLVLVPSLIVFGGAVAFVSGTLEALVPPDLEKALERDEALAEEFYGRARSRSAHFARQLALDVGRSPIALGTPAVRSALVGELERARERYDLFAVGYVPRAGSALSVSRAGTRGAEQIRPSEIERLPAGAAKRVLATGMRVLVEDQLAYGWLCVTLEPVLIDGEVVAAVWAGEYIDDPLARQLQRLKGIREEASAYRAQRPALQRFYIVLFALLTMLVLFGAVWTGLFLARQMTDPILELARGTRALARGELSYRVPAEARDEIGHLARSFNRMADEIQRQRGALEQRRLYIEMLLETVPVGVISLDEQGRVTTVNREAIGALRLSRINVGQTLDEALGPARQRVLDVVTPVLGKQTTRSSAEVELQDGERSFSVEVVTERLVISGREEGVLIVLDDLTRLRRAERLAAWGEVARRVAHEIKNPLTPIRLAAERMLRRYRKDPVEAADALQDGVSTIVREVTSLTSLVDEFSRFARFPELRLQPGDVGKVAADAVALFRQGRPRIGIVVRLAEELPEHWIDEEAIRRAVINLLDNAVSAIERRADEGRITVSTSWSGDHRSVVLAIEDDGVGLSEEDRRQLFLPSFTRRPGGTGLGLAIVHRVVTDHGGRIRAESGSNRGTRIVIELPAAGARAPAGNPVAES